MFVTAVWSVAVTCTSTPSMPEEAMLYQPLGASVSAGSTVSMIAGASASGGTTVKHSLVPFVPSDGRCAFSAALSGVYTARQQYLPNAEVVAPETVSEVAWPFTSIGTGVPICAPSPDRQPASVAAGGLQRKKVIVPVTGVEVAGAVTVAVSC